MRISTAPRLPPAHRRGPAADRERTQTPENRYRPPSLTGWIVDCLGRRSSCTIGDARGARLKTMTTVSSQQTAALHYARFAIGFDPRDRARLHALIDEVIDSGHWSEGEMTRALRGGLGGLQRRAGGRHRLAGRAAPWPRCISPACRGRPCCARRTRSWPRRSRRSTPAPRCSSSTATARTCACRSPTSRPRRALQAARGLPRAHRRPHRVRHRADRRILRRKRDLPDRGLRPRPRRRMEWPPGREPTETPGSTRCTRPRRSRPAREECSSRAAPR